MDQLRKLFACLNKNPVDQLLAVGQQGEGVQIFIGGESGAMPLDECSVVTAPYEVNGQVIGTVGVIGPTRMAYDRVIPSGYHREAAVERAFVSLNKPL